MTAEYKQSEKLNQFENIQHGFFTKKGGVSSGIYDSLNCAPNSDDNLNNVLENRRRVMKSLGLQDVKLFGVHQIHSTKVYQITSDMDNTVFAKGDALVTNDRNVALSVLGADCTPVLFASDQGVIGAAHAGWKGAVTGIIEEVVVKMCELGASCEKISACIGPTIHQQNYEVREDFIKEITKLSCFSVKEFIQEKSHKFYFDLPGYLIQQCERSGIQVESVDLDTYRLKDEFFSYRRNTHEQVKDYGRQISVIGFSKT
jgi:YfiH family protein